MKCLVVFLLLSSLGLSLAVPAFNFESLEKYLPSTAPKQEHKGEVRALLQALASVGSDQELEDQDTDGNDGDDGTVADLQGLFNVLAQVEAEMAHQQQDDKNEAIAQFWGWLGSMLWSVGKNFLKRKYCREEEEKLIAMLQELTDDEAIASEQDLGMQEAGNDVDDGDIDGDDIEAHSELQSLFNALKKAEMKIQEMHMDDTSAGPDTAKAEKAKKFKKWWRKVKRWFGKKIRKIVRKYLC